MIIWGAGLSALIAANAFPTATIFEAGKEGENVHKALLRFRSSAVGDAVGIDFKKIRVHKAIYHEGKFVAPNIALANLYSQKVIGRIADRSIWNLDPVDRYIAPEDFIEQLTVRAKGRIEFEHKVLNSDISFRAKETEQVISTIPMAVLAANFCGHQYLDAHKINFESKPIIVQRFRITNCDTYQTIYYPGGENSVYRASISGDMLILESAVNDDLYVDLNIVAESFGISSDKIELFETTAQRLGKIVEIDDEWRRKFIFDLSHDHNIFSLGRYACWRPSILLDDVLKDISVIKKLMNASGYERKLAQ